MRVLHLPTTVGGNPSGLNHHLRMLGIDSQLWAITQNYLGYAVDRVIADESKPAVLRALGALRASTYVLGRWDVINYNFGSTLFSKRFPLTGRRGMARLGARILNGITSSLQRVELGVLRARRIPIFVHYQGDDARQGDYLREHYEISLATQVPPGYYTAETDELKRRQIEMLSRYATGIYAVNPDLLNVLPPSAEFVPYGHITLTDCEPRYTQADHRRLVFAHAPSDRSVKGTDTILAALADLKAEGYEFDLDLIEGVSNAEALARYGDADVVIDQLYAGWYGGVALETMALGKPVVAYLRESDFGHLPPQMAADLPLFPTTPATITADLRAILELPREKLVERGKQSRAYVERWHDPLRIASRIADDYRRGRETLRRGHRNEESRGAS